MPSNSAREKIERACYQLDNARKLIASLPTRYMRHETASKIIRETDHRLWTLIDEVTELYTISKKIDKE